MLLSCVGNAEMQKAFRELIVSNSSIRQGEANALAEAWEGEVSGLGGGCDDRGAPLSSCARRHVAVLPASVSSAEVQLPREGVGRENGLRQPEDCDVVL